MMENLSDEELHRQMWSTLCKLNNEMMELAMRGLDVNVQVLGIDSNLYTPKTKPEIVVRITRLVACNSDKPEGKLVPFKPVVIENAP